MIPLDPRAFSCSGSGRGCARRRNKRGVYVLHKRRTYGVSRLSYAPLCIFRAPHRRRASEPRRVPQSWCCCRSRARAGSSSRLHPYCSWAGFTGSSQGMKRMPEKTMGILPRIPRRPRSNGSRAGSSRGSGCGAARPLPDLPRARGARPRAWRASRSPSCFSAGLSVRSHRRLWPRGLLRWC